MIRIEKIINSLSIKANRIAAASIVAMMLLTTADVILRLFRHPIPGTYEVVGLLGSLVISFSLAYTSIEKGHIAVEFLVQKFSEKAQGVIGAVNALISSTFFGIVSYQSFIYATELMESGEVSLTLQMPTYPFVYGISIGCTFLCIVLIFEILLNIPSHLELIPSN